MRPTCDNDCSKKARRFISAGGKVSGYCYDCYSPVLRKLMASKEPFRELGDVDEDADAIADERLVTEIMGS